MDHPDRAVYGHSSTVMSGFGLTPVKE